MTNLTKETIRCIDFIVLQSKKGWNFVEIRRQCIGSYGYLIYFNAECAIYRNLNKDIC